MSADRGGDTSEARPGAEGRGATENMSADRGEDTNAVRPGAALRILQLYPEAMNIYGDWGNTLVLSRRAAEHGLPVELLTYNQGDELPTDVDLVVGGGGQDSGQDVIQDDLLAIGGELRAMARDDVPMLVICGLYQLFGHFFRTQDGHTIQGIGILDLETYAGEKRLIGNVAITSEQFGDVFGYENHSGQTFLGAGVQPLGTVVAGAGNNDEDDTEGARARNVIGSYLHGSLLPKNPAVADHLIAQAATRRFGSFTPRPLDDSLAENARAVARRLPR